MMVRHAHRCLDQGIDHVPAVGLIGVVVAALKPGLGPGYEQINIIPAWGLVRPLPVEMVAVGCVAILLTLRTAQRLSSEEDRGR